MTCIVGVIERDKTWIGADALAVAGYDAYDLASPKIFRNGPYLIGVAGSPRVSQLLQYELSLPDDDRVKDPRRFMVSHFERSERYDSIGCGQDLALGSLFETATGKMPPKKRIERALKCAERFSAGVRGPFTILSLEAK